MFLFLVQGTWYLPPFYLGGAPFNVNQTFISLRRFVRKKTAEDQIQNKGSQICEGISIILSLPRKKELTQAHICYAFLTLSSDSFKTLLWLYLYLCFRICEKVFQHAFSRQEEATQCCNVFNLYQNLYVCIFRACAKQPKIMLKLFI